MAGRKPISARTRFLVLERDGYACQCCGAKAPNTTLHVDHIRPVAAGGGNEMGNLRALCVTCNFGKADTVGNVVSIRGPSVGKTVLRMENLPDVKLRGEALSQPVFWVGLQWAVTSYGIEARDGTYCIEADRLWEGERSWDWSKQMQSKLWVDQQDFLEAFRFAQSLFASLRKIG